ncbi:MAG: alpha/beta fold hydrolase [Actinomycetota bacterium]
MSELAYDVAGSGEPLVLVHGLASSRRCWDLVVDDLARDFTVYAIDLPGHGESAPLPGQSQTPATEMALAVGRFLDEQGIDRAHMCGNSLGGWTVLEVPPTAAHRPSSPCAPPACGSPSPSRCRRSSSIAERPSARDASSRH